jgi:hypothetical protein
MLCSQNVHYQKHSNFMTETLMLMLWSRWCVSIFCVHGFSPDLSLLPLSSKPIVSSIHPCYSLFEPIMAPVIRTEMNGSQALLLHDDASEDLKNQGWDMLIEKFQGYKLQVAKEFTLTFDGYREKVGDL